MAEMNRLISEYSELEPGRIQKSEYTPVFQYLSNKGFEISGEYARALFECYILKQTYCKSMDDFWVLYEAVYETVRFAQNVELWDPNYRVYDGLKGRLLMELDTIEQLF